MAHWRIYFAPHCDDEQLTMGFHMADMRKRGENILVVFMNLSGNTGARAKLNGVNSTPPYSGCPVHGYTHNPDIEFYDGAPVLELDEIRDSRLKESVSALGAIATIPTISGVTPGAVAYETAGLPDSFGNLPDAADMAEAIMRDVYTRYPNSFLYTTSEGDAHPDHAACGRALKAMRASADLGPELINSRFFVSKLYWKENNNNAYPPAILAASTPPGSTVSTLAWYNSASCVAGTYTELSNIMRNRVIKPFSAWSPADGVYGVGGHSVPDQWADCFGTGVNIQCLMHQ
jgi:LmbE family N-acetylglucosaminyl deacetylase